LALIGNKLVILGDQPGNNAHNEHYSLVISLEIGRYGLLVVINIW